MRSVALGLLSLISLAQGVARAQAVPAPASAAPQLAPATTPTPVQAPAPAASPAPAPSPLPTSAPAPEPTPASTTATAQTAEAERPARGAAGGHIEPLRLALECQGDGRTKACPSFLLGLIEATPLLMPAPRAAAQVVLYVTAVPVANDDRLHLRFVGELGGAPESVEVDVNLDTRASDDEQRAQLRPAFLRGLALYIAAIDPQAVKVEISLPSAPVARPQTTPWGVNVEITGSGSWTDGYKSANTSTTALLYRLDARSRYTLELTGSGGLTRRPPLVVDGREVSLDTNEWSLGASAYANWNLNDDWAVATSAWATRMDPKGQLRSQLGVNAGVEWDLFPSDDPRGNVLAVANFLTLRRDELNFVNELDQTTAVYGFNRVSVVGKVRKDHALLGLNVGVGFEVLHPGRRYNVTASPSISWQLGDHVDIELSVEVGARGVPLPIIPEDDLEAQGRASYAEPLFAEGELSLKIHFDPTNGERNNRFENL